MLDTFTRLAARTHTPEERLRSARLALRLAFLVLAAPGLPLGLLYLLTRPAPLAWSVTLALVGLSLGLGLLPLRLARQAAQDTTLPPERRALTAAFQAGSAPAIPFLVGCAALASWPAAALLWALAAFLYLFAWRQVATWTPAAPTPAS
ncbi:hypothetical protein SAMN04488058_10210 [Deinococcus reticulitermitis]|uniref:Uncharacterized protein n=1 Tax=Deinococcus reticulitermitis TaxID=856736 RepID=A0A1H6U5J6_9DEIO|nr:hypothetical protein [Deinococcus reticulitermitis]SEI83640.1 hypothetical protein SAMN04488058_10210 [Deinococcus reticulitermitis]